MSPMCYRAHLDHAFQSRRIAVSDSTIAEGSARRSILETITTSYFGRIHEQGAGYLRKTTLPGAGGQDCAQLFVKDGEIDIMEDCDWCANTYCNLIVQSPFKGSFTWAAGGRKKQAVELCSLPPPSTTRRKFYNCSRTGLCACFIIFSKLALPVQCAR